MCFRFQIVFKFSLFVLFVFNLGAIVFAGGVLDTTFGTGGAVAAEIGESARAAATVIQPDGKIVVVGDVVRGANGRDLAVVRFNSNGTLDTGFGSGGKVYTAISDQDDLANAVALQPDGKIVVVGSTTPFDFPSADFLVVRYNSNGTLDSTFGDGGFVTINQSTFDKILAVVVQPDGKIVAAGNTSQNNYEAVIIRFNNNGTLDLSFANGGLFFKNISPLSLDDSFRALTLLPNGQILAGGSAWDGGGVNVLVMLETNGIYAQNFGNGGTRLEFWGATGAGTSFGLATLPDGKILVVTRLGLRRFLSNGDYDQTFSGSYINDFNVTSVGSDLAVGTDGRIIVLNQDQSGYFKYTVAYSKTGLRINQVYNLTGNDIAIQPDNKFLIINSSETNFIVSRFVSITSRATRLADFDNDQKTDPAIYRYSSVYVLRSSLGVVGLPIQPSDRSIRFIPEDFVHFLSPAESAIYYWESPGLSEEPSAYFRAATENRGNSTVFQWGMRGDILVGGDFDGKVFQFTAPVFRTQSELTVFRPSNGYWFIYNRSTNSFRAVQWGQDGDKPVPADYDYDGITDIAVYRPSNGTWYVQKSSDGGLIAAQFGVSTDIPLTGDFDGDGRADFVVYRPENGMWYLQNTMEGFRAMQFGLSTDSPVPGDYDGDGRHDIAVFRNGVWYIQGSQQGFYAVQWGTTGNDPVTVRYAYNY